MGTARTRRPKDLRVSPFQPAINSFTLHLNAEGKSPKTVRTYAEAAQWFAAEHLRRTTDHSDWDEVTADDVRAWTVRLLTTYSDSYANNQYRVLQQFFKWWSTDEELPNPMAKLHPPAVGEKVVPVFNDQELAKLLKHCEGKTFTQRRDYAILALFKETGLRRSSMDTATRNTSAGVPAVIQPHTDGSACARVAARESKMPPTRTSVGHDTAPVSRLVRLSR